MSAIPLILAMASGTVLLASGYLFGAKRGRSARAALFTDLTRSRAELSLHGTTIAAQQQQVADLSREISRRAEPPGGAVTKELEAMLQPLVDAKAGDVQELRQELRSFMRTLSDQERGQDALREELRQGFATIGKTSDPEKLNRDMQRVLQPLLRKQEDTAALREMMREMLAPMIERDRIGKELSRLEAGSGLGELPRMLDAIAETGAFTTVVLSDDVGLPLAANGSALDVEMLAGMASFLLTLADRAERNGVARPQAVVVLDESNQHILHRIFSVDSVRFTLTAVSRGVYVAPGALDAALGKLEKLLAKKVA